MADYDFSTLGSTDLEELVRDLLNAKEKISNSRIEYRTFKDGKDKGIDFAYSTNEDPYKIIGQVKHYYRSGYDLLISVLKKTEINNVTNLKPERYILATSVDLSLHNKKEIQNLFHPYIKSVSDVYGKSDLNMYLEGFPKILENHFKLWYSSTAVLRKIINYSIESRSAEFTESYLKQRIRLYVITEYLAEAKIVLSKNKFLILTGEPGVGKTTLAEIIIYEYLKNDFELTYIYDNIKDVEKIMSNDDKKQIFYFDDFLGHTAMEIAKTKGSETAMLRILKRISRSVNKVFILTTRTFILNSAIQDSENLRTFTEKSKSSVFKLIRYSAEEKTKILYNHIEESLLNEELKIVLYKKRNFIIGHANFSPRSVEFITTAELVGDFTPEYFEEFIIKNFNKPDKIWQHAYEQQINDIDKMLLSSLISFGDETTINYLEAAFNNRLTYEVTKNHFTRPLNAFRNSLKKLDEGFIAIDYFEQYDITYIKLINHSLTDFLINYLKNNKDEVERIVESAKYLEQLTSRIYLLEGSIYVPLISETIKIKLFNGYFIHELSENEDRLMLCLLLYKYFDLSEVGIIISDNLIKITDWLFLHDDTFISYHFIKFLKDIDNQEIINALFITSNNYYSSLLLTTDEFEEATELMDLLAIKFNLLKHDDFYEKDCDDDLLYHMNELFQQRIDSVIDDLLSIPTIPIHVDEAHMDLLEARKNLQKFNIYLNVNFSEFGRHDWFEIYSKHSRDSYY